LRSPLIAEETADADGVVRAAFCGVAGLWAFL
jgi:hypothetical protein